MLTVDNRGPVHNCALPGPESGHPAPAHGSVGVMARRVQDRTYRSTAELIRAVRDEYLLTQEKLAQLCGLSRHQLCRYENGTREPGLAVLRRMLDAVGLAFTFGVEPTTAAIEERLARGVDAVSLDIWLMANRVIWPALTAGVPVVVGGEFAAALQGVPVEDPEMVLHVRLKDLDALHRVVRTARCSLGVFGASLSPLEPEEITVGSELVVAATAGTIRVLITAELPTARVIAVERQFTEQENLVDMPVVPLEALLESGSLGAAATALARRLLQRTALHG